MWSMQDGLQHILSHIVRDALDFYLWRLLKQLFSAADGEFM